MFDKFVFERYMLRNIAIATVFVGLTLSVIIFLTQSLRFLELVIESGAPSAAFWQLTFLALPRFMEVILPLAVMAGVVFIYSRMISDSEIVVLRGSGLSPVHLARPALLFAVFVTFILLSITMVIGPKSLSKMQDMRHEIKAQLSTLFLKEGVFNQVRDGLTVYVRERGGDGELYGLLIHDSRRRGEDPSTVMAKRGVLVSDEDGFQVLVYDGSRQNYDAKKKILSRLDFENYTIDFPSSGQVRARSSDPDEMTIFELMETDFDDAVDMRKAKLEVHKRFISPFLAIGFTLIGCVSLLAGPYDRRGHVRRVVGAVFICTVLQALYLSAFNFARKSDLGLVLMYLIVLIPIIACGFLLSSASEGLRREMLYGDKSGDTA